MPKVITVSGFIGAGKSTFINMYAKYLRDTYGVSVLTCLEPVESNELLPMMYEDPIRWTYTSQVRFLVDKVKSMREAFNSSDSIVLVERDYREQRIFIEAQKACQKVTQIEYESYMELYNLCEEFVPKVLNYHLDIPYDVCIRRMESRGRYCESLGDPFYYRSLYNVYEESYGNHPPEFTISETLDIDVYRNLDKFTFKGVYTT